MLHEEDFAQYANLTELQSCQLMSCRQEEGAALPGKPVVAQLMTCSWFAG